MAAAVMLSVLAIPVSFMAPELGAAMAIWALRALFMGLAGAVLLLLGLFMVGGVSR